MMKSYPFHLQQNTDLSVVDQALFLGKQGNIAPYELAEYSQKTEDSIRKRIHAPLVQFGILDKWALAPFGNHLAALRDHRGELVGEAIHLQLYTMHWIEPRAYFSFAYAAICDWLYERGSASLDADTESALVSHVIAKASLHYSLSEDTISFSRESVRGAKNWLRTLEPRILIEDNFALRRTTDAYALLWAVAQMYRRDGRAWGTRLPLAGNVEETLARVLLLSPDSLQRTVEIVATQFDYRRNGFFGKGSEGGFGQWVLLTEPLALGATAPGNDEAVPTTEPSGLDETEFSNDTTNEPTQE